jgi:hypothetical protein
VQSKLSSTVAVVTAAINADGKENLVIVRTDVKASRLAWNQLVQFATSYQTTAAGVKDAVVTAKASVPA